MHPEEEKRLNAKWAVWHCPYDKVKKTNMPTTIVSAHFGTREEADNYLEENYPKRAEYGVFKTDGETGFY